MNEDGHVSNSRRGVLAAGLAAAVVGSMGVVWTLSANADEIPGAETSAAAPAAEAAAPVPVPPSVLPWGDQPQQLTRAQAGANSAAVAAAGADAAPADTSGSLIPKPEFAPKGRNSNGNVLKTMQTSIVPPTPPPAGAVQADAAAAGDVYFHYAVGSQAAETDGTWANLTIAKPALANGDFHTLAELAVQSADGQQIVEVGWNVDRAVNGDSDPHLFVYHWKNRQPGCYNGCGFTMYSKTVKPGDTLPVGAQKRFGIQHSGGVWWIAYDSEWIGYFPDTIWNGTYTRGGFVQWFGEVAAASQKTCTDMGNGTSADKDTAARIGTISFTNGPEVKFSTRATSDLYSIVTLSDRTFRYGGAGAC